MSSYTELFLEEEKQKKRDQIESKKLKEISERIKSLAKPDEKEKFSIRYKTGFMKQYDVFIRQLQEFNVNNQDVAKRDKINYLANISRKVNDFENDVAESQGLPTKDKKKLVEYTYQLRVIIEYFRHKIGLYEYIKPEQLESYRKTLINTLGF